MYAVLLPRQPVQPISIQLGKPSPAGSDSLPIKVVPPEKVVQTRPSVGIDTRVFPEEQPSTLPSDAELLDRLEKVGIRRPDAQAALEKFGSVKVNAILEREERLRASARAQPSGLEGNDEDGTSAGVISQGRSAERSGPNDTTAASAQDDASPYQEMANAKHSSASPVSSEEAAAYRSSMASGYLESVHSAETGTLHNSPNGLACSGSNCLAPR